MRHFASRSDNPVNPIPPERRANLPRFLLTLAALVSFAAGCGAPKPIRYYEISYPPVGQAKMPAWTPLSWCALLPPLIFIAKIALSMVPVRRRWVRI